MGLFTLARAAAGALPFLPRADRLPDRVLRVDDLERPSDGLPPTDGLRFMLADDGRVIVRPSGTEAKIKSYLQVRVAVEDGDVATARRAATARITALKDDLAALLA